MMTLSVFEWIAISIAMVGIVLVLPCTDILNRCRKAKAAKMCKTVGYTVGIIGIVGMCFSVVAILMCCSGNRLKTVKTTEYKITISGDTYYYTKDDKVVKEDLNKKSYKLSNRGYSYLEVYENVGTWWVFQMDTTTSDIFIAEDDIVSLEV